METELPALAVRELTVRYGKRIAVDALSLSIAPGEVVALLGPNGAGKSSLLSAVCGVAPCTGEVTVHGRALRADPIAVKRQLGVAMQPIFLYDFLTAKEHVEFVARAHDVECDGGEQLEQVGLAREANRLCRELSYGMRQRVALAAAIGCKAKVVLLDETLNGLDPRAAMQARESIAQQAAAGIAVILSTHVLGAVDRLCTRVIIMDHGKLTADVSGEDLEEVRAKGAAGLESLYLKHTEASA